MHEPLQHSGKSFEQHRDVELRHYDRMVRVRYSFKIKRTSKCPSLTQLAK